MAKVQPGGRLVTVAAIEAQAEFEQRFMHGSLLGGPVQSIELTKGDAAAWQPSKMTGFLAAIASWAKAMADDGFEIRSEPLAGPGTMAWKAVKK